jgi:ankyrin repeat protein
VHSDGFTALHYAAFNGNLEIVGLLIESNAAVNAKDYDGCAMPLRHRRVGRPSPRPSAVQVNAAALCRAQCGSRVARVGRDHRPAHARRRRGRRGPLRVTLTTCAPFRFCIGGWGGRAPAPSAVQVHAAALCREDRPIRRDRRAAHARRRRGRPGQNEVTLRCAAQPTDRNSRARAGARQSNTRIGVGSSRSTRRRRGRCTPARRLRPATRRPRAPSLPKLPAPTDVPMDVPSALADPAGREATAHTALAP